MPPLIPINTVDQTQNYEQVKIEDQQLLNLMKKIPLNNQMPVKTKHNKKENTNEYKNWRHGRGNRRVYMQLVSAAQ